ncbi:exo-1 [Phytophthora nicotianae]|nr:exo-1 [Phytophthora nicotianae]
MKSMDMTLHPGRTYRYFKGQPVFPFGWGLSYTTFSLSVDSGTTASSTTSTNSSSGRNVTTMEISDTVNATVTVVVSNDGDVAGDEVVFAFFKPLNTGVKGPATLLNLQLFDYQRVSLKPSGSTRVSFTVQRSDLSLIDENGNRVSYPGSYEIIVSNGVRERVSFSVEVSDEEKVIQSQVQPFPSSDKSTTSVVSASSRSHGSWAILWLVVVLVSAALENCN